MRTHATSDFWWTSIPQHAGNTKSMIDLRSVSTRGDRHQSHDSATRARSDSVGYQGRSGPDFFAGSMAPLSSGLAPVWRRYSNPIFVVLDVTNGDTRTS